METKKSNQGKKIIFVYPPEVVKQQLMVVLSENEFEVYSLRDQKKVRQIASAYGESIFFLNLDDGLKEDMWEQFIQKIKLEIADLQLGLLSFNVSSPEQIQHYVLDYGVNCGFIQLKQGAKAAEEMLLKTLQVNEAKGRRKYVRYSCRESDQVSLNFKVGDSFIKGAIEDISSVGMACRILSPQVSLVKNQMVPDIQLKLRGTLIHTGGVVLGQRNMPDGTLKFVILFTDDKLHKSKNQIRSFIHFSLQKKFNEEFKLD